MIKNSFTKKILVFAAVCLLSAEISPLFALQKTKVFGGEAGWPASAKKDGIALGKGRFGFDSLQLATNSCKTSQSTDLLISFDGENKRDESGHYQIEDDKLVHTVSAAMGKGAALSRGVSGGISLKGNANSIFGRSGLIGSFTIEFWLAPAIAENGEVVFSWRSSRNTGNYSMYQMITSSFFNNHLQWEFSNVFDGYKDGDVVLSGVNTIVPGRWTHHSLSFDEETGLMEYFVDGRSEGVVYITKSGHENGEVCEPYLGVKANIEICPQYTGRIDDFRIERTADASKSNDLYASGRETYKIDGGTFVTEPILVSDSAVLDSVNAVMNVPPETAVLLFVRSGDNCYNWDDNYPEWKQVYPGERIKDVSGLYFQIEAQLLPDGGGMKTPSVTEISLSYTEQPEPLPPFTVHADAGNGSVTLTWSYSVDDTAGGYYVYYGNRSGEYLGRAAVEGPSPVNAGNTTSLTLTGLKNGTIYYFAVSAWSRIDGRINGSLSKEVYARPSVRGGSDYAELTR